VAELVLDSSVLLALFDGQDALHQRAATALARRRRAGAVPILPAVVLAEVLVGAARLGALEARREQVRATGAPLVPVDEPVAVGAARLRAEHPGLRLPDALVLATAQLRDADVLTGDQRWERYYDRVEVV